MDQIQNIVVVGAGTMGHSLALVFARGGFKVYLVDKDAAILSQAMKLITSATRTLYKSACITEGQVAEILTRVQTTTDLVAAACVADVVIEAVYEDPGVKREVFFELDKHCPKHAIIASNTAYMNIFELAGLERQDKLVIAHWFAPPHIIPAVEVVPGDKTSKETINTVVQLLIGLGKKPVLMSRYIPGFIVNRIQAAIWQEAFSLVDNGYASIEEVDTAVKASLGVRLPVIGVLQSCDFNGLDAIYKAMSTTPVELFSTKGPPRIIAERVEEGNLGVKTGKGLYDYESKTTEELYSHRDSAFIKVLNLLTEIGAMV